MTSKQTFACPNCNQPLEIGDDYPIVRSKLVPGEPIRPYVFTSEDIRRYLKQMASYYAGLDVEVVVAPKHVEKKSKNGKVRSYTALQIAFSDNITEQPDDSFFSRLGVDPTNVRVQKDIYMEMIKAYQFDRKEIDDALSSYKRMEELEDEFGINEKYLQEIRSYIAPRKITTSDKLSWVIFIARVDKIITNMLENVATDKVDGVIEIHSIRPVNEKLLQFTVYVHPASSNTSSIDNPIVREFMMNDKK